MRPTSLPVKLLFSALFAISLAQAHAEDAPTAVETAKPDTAAQKAGILKALGLEDATQITYLDEQGKPLDESSFFGQVAQGKSFGANKSKVGDDVKATFRLESKDEADKAKQVSYKVKPGGTFPAFHLNQLGGGSADKKQFAGHPTLINFYFAECAPCRQEVPDLNALTAKYPDMKFLAVTYDQVGESRKFVQDTKFNWAIAPNASAFIKQVGIKWYPSFALIDKNGKLVAIKTHAEIEGSDDHNVAAWVEHMQASAKLQ
jgi:thiol-disulfide isomerase/thioredoxin